LSSVVTASQVPLLNGRLSLAPLHLPILITPLKFKLCLQRWTSRSRTCTKLKRDRLRMTLSRRNLIQPRLAHIDIERPSTGISISTDAKRLRVDEFTWQHLFVTSRWTSVQFVGNNSSKATLRNSTGFADMLSTRRVYNNAGIRKGNVPFVQIHLPAMHSPDGLGRRLYSFLLWLLQHSMHVNGFTNPTRLPLHCIAYGKFYTAWILIWNIVMFFSNNPLPSWMVTIFTLLYCTLYLNIPYPRYPCMLEWYRLIHPRFPFNGPNPLTNVPYQLFLPHSFQVGLVAFLIMYYCTVCTNF